MIARAALEAFLSRHAEDSLYIAAARLVYAQGGRVDATSPIVRDELLRTYRMRADHLSRHASDQALRLAAELKSFCIALEEAPDCRAVAISVTAPDGRSYLFFEDVSSRKLLCAALTYDARLLSDDEYERIWGKPRPYSRQR